jgi:hypothetical protein
LVVTGVPRSGTTWLARELASAPACSLTGREPMNPNGRQYKLGGTLDTWVRLSRPSQVQVRALRRAYRGLAPGVYGRYGHRQWRAALPSTRVVVKDPYAVLSLDTIARVTDAVPVLVYRHPAAVLSSYRRMGWRPDVTEVAAALAGEPGTNPPPDGAEHDLVAGMAWFWAALNRTALDAMEHVPGAVVVDHAELAAGGAPAMNRLFAACGLAPTWSPSQPSASRQRPLARASSTAEPGTGTPVLHRLDRPSEQVATQWRSTVDDDEVAVLDALTGPTLQRLEAARIRLS